MLSEAFVGGNEPPSFVEHSRPKNVVIHPLVRRPADVENVMAETAKALKHCSINSGGNVRVVHRGLSRTIIQAAGYDQSSRSWRGSIAAVQQGAPGL